MKRVEDAQAMADEVVVRLSKDEIGWIISCCGEPLEVVDEVEFHTRVGATRAEILDLIQEADGVYSTCPEAKSDVDWSRLDGAPPN